MHGFITWSVTMREGHRLRVFENRVLRKILDQRGIKVKVKCTLVQALRLCTGLTAHRGSTGIALLFFDHGTRRG